MSQPRRIFNVDLAQDMRTIVAMADNLTPYVYESELYGMLSDPSLPRLTVGGLLMRLARLSLLSDQLSPSQQVALAAAQRKLAEVQQAWAVHYEGKLLHELKARITALEHFAHECMENLRACADNYPSAMEKRVIVEHLRDAAVDLGVLSDELKGKLTALDNAISRCVEKAPFCWSENVQAAYPQPKFWFLYMAARKPPPKK
ncbi:hypothetical protein FBQ95_08465 [Chloroflexi bacterium CFX3]|nr:hypothetical protein [Chloroflexi bacterium CFX3]